MASTVVPVEPPQRDDLTPDEGEVEDLELIEAQNREALAEFYAETHYRPQKGFRIAASRQVSLRHPGVPHDPPEPVEVETAPEIPAAERTPILPKLMPVVMVVGVLGSVIWMARSGGRMSPMMLMFPIMMLASAGTMISHSLSGGKAGSELLRRRQEFLRYLERLNTQRSEQSQEICEEEERFFPHPGVYRAYIRERMLWHIRSDHNDFLCLRIGTGKVSPSEAFIFPDMPHEEDLEPVSLSALRVFSHYANTAEEMPLVVSLHGFDCVAVTGGDAAATLFRSMVMNLALTHHPTELSLAVACRNPQWLEMVKWLPHTVRRGEDSLQPLNLLDATDSERADVLSRGTVVLITDDNDFLTTAGQYFPYVVGIFDQIPCAAALTLDVEDDGEMWAIFGDDSEYLGTADALSQSEAMAIGCALAGLHTREGDDGESAGGNSESGPRDLFSLLGMGEADNFLAARDWTPKVGRERMRVPIGLDDDRRPVYLDLKEAAQGGMGPHGVVVGATGSGKSELLRTLVVALLASHSPDQLNMVLVDFKGGATFSTVESAPHVSAVITNLADDKMAVHRMFDALTGELNRRQEVLHAAGSFPNVDEYNKARQSGLVDADKFPALPALFIIVDEFAELIAQRPDFGDLFVQIGRLGRSLHVHLLLSSQRMDTGKVRGLESHLSYRLALKTFSATDSRSVINCSDAYTLPQLPGAGFLYLGEGDLRRFRSFYVSGAAHGPSMEMASVQEAVNAMDSALSVYVNGVEAVTMALPVQNPLLDTLQEDQHLVAGGESHRGGMPGDAEGAEDATAAEESLTGEAETAPAAEAEDAHQQDAAEDEGAGPTQTHVLLSRFPAHWPQIHQVWVPSLPDMVTYDDLADALSVGTAARYNLDDLSQKGAIAVLDIPIEQRRRAMRLQLEDFEHGVIVGTTRTGKSEAIVTIMSALCMQNSPQKLKFYGIDAGGGALSVLEQLPHCAAICSAGAEEKLERLEAEVLEEMRLRAAEESPTDQHIILIIDGWASLKEQRLDFEERVRHIIRDGLAYNVHVLMTAQRWSDMRSQIKDVIGNRWELRLGDAGDSIAGRPFAEAVPEKPGFGITKERQYFLFIKQTEEGLREITERWKDVPAVEPLRLLPREIQWTDLPKVEALNHLDWSVPIGIEGNGLTPYAVNTGSDLNLFVVGDGSGKSTFLRGFVRAMTAQVPPEKAKFVIVDYRRQLLGVCPQENLAGYASTRKDVDQFVRELQPLLEARLPAGVTDPQALRERSWWSGPDIYLVVDDYELVATGSYNPLAPLAELLPYGRDIGLHVVLARRCAGLSRNSFETFLARLRELQPTTLMMSGSPDEGALAGGRKPRPLPPGRADLIDGKDHHVVVQLGMAPIEEDDKR